MESEKVLKSIIFILIVILVILIFVKTGNSTEKEAIIKISEENRSEIVNEPVKLRAKKELDWKLTLVNSETKLPEDYRITLKSIDEYREFDSRAISYLNDMIKAMKSQGIQNIWVQSAYRSVEEQRKIYNNKVAEYKRQGKTEEEAKRLTEKVINKPGYSEHNLGLAVDFNYVNNDFENTKAFKWLKENAEDYGFIFRYPKEKENITKVTYEPWHWRYIGKENAKKMNELGLCLEEYIEYLNKEE